MVMQMGGGIRDDDEKADDFGVHKQLCCSFFNAFVYDLP